MAAHRYWRLSIIGAEGVYCGFAEIELRDSFGGADRSGSGTATASAEETGHVAANAVDNNTSTVWSTYPAHSPQWWAYDFGSGSAYDIVELYIVPRQDGFPREAPSSFDWQWSDDGIAWTNQHHRSGISWTSAAQTFDVSTGGTGTATRFTVAARPLVLWRATVPTNGFFVVGRPRIVWDAGTEDPTTRFTVHTAPVVKWELGTGSATTECIGGEGTVPPPDEPPVAGGEENYVF